MLVWSKSITMKSYRYIYKLLELFPNIQMRKFMDPGEGKDPSLTIPIPATGIRNSTHDWAILWNKRGIVYKILCEVPGI